MRRGKTTAMGLFLGPAALAFWFTGLGTAYAQALPGGTLDPTSIQKYQWELVKPPVMPTTSTAGGIDYYEIAVRQFTQQVVYPALIGGGAVPATTVWSYGSVTTAGTFNYPAFTIEAAYNRPVRVKWINDLKDGSGNFRPHLLPVDQTLHWTNPPGGATDRDSRPIFAATPGPYTGPVPLVTHVHGAHVGEESDGFVPLAQTLAAAQVAMLSTGGTAKALREAGLKVTDLSAYTGFPEMLDGRVKTMHPKVHGGLLYLRGNEAHDAAVRQHGIEPIDLVVVNLYPFEQTVARPGTTLHERHREY